MRDEAELASIRLPIARSSILPGVSPVCFARRSSFRFGAEDSFMVRECCISGIEASTWDLTQPP
jgi:hypothetical protein